MAGRVYSVIFSLTAVIDGEDTLTLDVSPAAVVWNQEGEVVTNEDSSVNDSKAKWSPVYVTANVMKGEDYDRGWNYGFSIGSGCSFTVNKGFIVTDPRTGKWLFQKSSTGNVFELSAPKKTTDANGKEADTLWTNGTLRLTATKDGKTLTKNVHIALNALATWQMSVINGTMTATSSKIEQKFTDKGLIGTNYESRLEQTEKGLSSKVSQTELSAVAAGEGSSADIDLTGKDENTFYLTLFDFVSSPDLFMFGVKKDLYNYPAKTSYGNHEPVNGKGGFETFVQWQEHYAAWGARDVDRAITSYTKAFFVDNSGFAVGSIGQYEQNGPVYIYLRGGAKYHVYCDHMDVNIHLATQDDIDNFKKDDATPALSIPHGNAVEPVTDKVAMSSEITQTADNIKLIVDGLGKTGIDIKDGLINAIAGMFNFVGKDGKPYIKVEQDSKGYPHLVFYDPATGEAAYDLGYTGLEQIVNSSQRQYWENMSYINTYAAKSLVYAEEIYRTATISSQAFRYHGAYFIRSKGGAKQFVPAEAANCDNVIYTDMSVDADNIPTASKIPDGWHLIYKKHTYTQTGGTTTLPDGSTANLVDSSSDTIYFNMFYTSGGKISGTTHEHELAISRLTGSAKYSWGDYTPFIDGVSEESPYFFFPE